VSGIADRKGIRLEVEIPNNIPRVYADENRIIQVLTNLVNNALKFTPAGGEVGIQVEYTELLEDKVRVCVRDTGRGIHPRQQRRIFDRHYQARKRDSAEGGMGLGLYLCREIIQMHGDEITVQSDLGTGSTFIFTLTRYCPVLDERELDERDSEVCDLEYLTQ